MNAKSIRNLTVQILKGKTDVFGSVFNSKVTPAPTDTLPIISVYFRSSTGDQQSAKRIAFVESGIVEINVLVSSSVNWADAADDIIEQVKTALFSSQQWLDAVGRVSSYEISYALTEPKNAEAPIAIASMQISIGSFNTFEPS